MTTETVDSDNLAERLRKWAVILDQAGHIGPPALLREAAERIREWRTDTPAGRAMVLVTVTDGIRPRVCEATWDREYKIWDMSGGHREQSDVSAWMPMPEPFKPEPRR